MIIFTDIDDTLMKTARKITGDISGLQIGAVNTKSKTVSYIDGKRQQLIEQLLLRQKCIPVTARSKHTFKNLQLRFNHHAVLSFGATILSHDGLVEESWHHSMWQQSRQVNGARILDIIHEKLAFLLEGFECKVSVEDDIWVHASFRDKTWGVATACAAREEDNTRIKSLRQHIEDILHDCGKAAEFYFYQSQRDLALIPSFIRKENAVRFLLEHHYDSEDLTIGIGDHANDLSFMAVCDFVMVPTDSTLMNLIRKVCPC